MARVCRPAAQPKRGPWAERLGRPGVPSFQLRPAVMAPWTFQFAPVIQPMAGESTKVVVWPGRG
jgi:hypothetical protein